MESHRLRNPATSGRSIRAKARPGRPPETIATTEASSSVNPRCTRASTMTSKGTLPTCTVRHLEDTVGGKSSSDTATRRNTAAVDGSSSVLSIALAACSVIEPASGSKKIARFPSTGRSAARVTTLRICSTPKLVAPSGSTRETSGCVSDWTSRQERHGSSWAPPVGQRIAAAKRRASVALPTDSGPKKR